MKSFIYYIIPLLVGIATILGREYWLLYLMELDVFDCTYTKNHIEVNSVLGTILFVLGVMLIFIYLIFMKIKAKNKKEYSFLEKVLLTMSITFLIEVVLNGFLFPFLLGDAGLMAVAFYFTYFLTVPIALGSSYLWIIWNDR